MTFADAVARRWRRHDVRRMSTRACSDARRLRLSSTCRRRSARTPTKRSPTGKSADVGRQTAPRSRDKRPTKHADLGMSRPRHCLLFSVSGSIDNDRQQNHITTPAPILMFAVYFVKRKTRGNVSVSFTQCL